MPTDIDDMPAPKRPGEDAGVVALRELEAIAADWVARQRERLKAKG